MPTTKPEESGSTSKSSSERNDEERDGDDVAAPDVVLDVPSIRVKEIELKVGDLKARLALHAELARLVRLDAGVDVCLEETELQLKDVEGGAKMKVSLREVARILERSLTSVDRNPQIVETALEQEGNVRSGRHERGGPSLVQASQKSDDSISEADTAPAKTLERGRARSSRTSRALSRAIAAPRALLQRLRRRHTEP